MVAAESVVSLHLCDSLYPCCVFVPGGCDFDDEESHARHSQYLHNRGGLTGDFDPACPLSVESSSSDKLISAVLDP